MSLSRKCCLMPCMLFEMYVLPMSTAVLDLSFLSLFHMDVCYGWPEGEYVDSVMFCVISMAPCCTLHCRCRYNDPAVSFVLTSSPHRLPFSRQFHVAIRLANLWRYFRLMRVTWLAGLIIFPSVCIISGASVGRESSEHLDSVRSNHNRAINHSTRRPRVLFFHLNTTPCNTNPS